MLNILFRVDSSASIGLGHVMRCLVLAQRLKEEDNSLAITFASRDLDGNINHKILKDSYKLHLLQLNSNTELISHVKELKIDLLIIDSYEINYDDEVEISSNTDTKLLMFDDMYCKHMADIILNHGMQVKESSYKALVQSQSTLLVGEQYTILRDEFFSDYQNPIVEKTILISFGGNDVKNISYKVAKILQEIDKDYKITIITSSVNLHVKEIKNDTRIELLVDINNMAEVISKHSFVVCASGGNLFEVIALKKKFINIKVADNQSSIVDFLKEKNINTTVELNNISKESLKNKIQYIDNNDIYSKLSFKFSKHTLAKQILKELR